MAEKIHSIISVGMPLWHAYVEAQVTWCQEKDLATEAEALDCLGPAAESNRVVRAMESLTKAQETLATLIADPASADGDIREAYYAVGRRLEPLMEPLRVANACKAECEEAAKAYDF